jgi:hypothetical protein
MSDHEGERCPGLGQCVDAWHDEGCEAFWRYADASGFVIHGGMYDEQDAMIKTLWTGPDGPDEVWHRRSQGGRWIKEV